MYRHQSATAPILKYFQFNDVHDCISIRRISIYICHMYSLNIAKRNLVSQEKKNVSASYSMFYN